MSEEQTTSELLAEGVRLYQENSPDASRLLISAAARIQSERPVTREDLQYALSNYERMDRAVARIQNLERRLQGLTKQVSDLQNKKRFWIF